MILFSALRSLCAKSYTFNSFILFLTCFSETQPAFYTLRSAYIRFQAHELELLTIILITAGFGDWTMVEINRHCFLFDRGQFEFV